MTALVGLGHSNTQAERTSVPTTQKKGLRILLDWLGFTVNDEETNVLKVLDIFEVYLGISKESFQPGRKYYEGYQDSFVFENINIYYNGGTNQGIHVDITGQGCRFIEILYQKLGVQEYNWYHFIRNLRVHEKVKFTRIDIACDDFHGYFTAQMLLDKLYRGECKSKFKSWHPAGHYNFDGEVKTGLTIYFGSPTSRLQCTIYEKDKQLKLDYFWLRTELRFQKQRAEDIANAIIYNCDPGATKSKDIGIIFAGVLKEYITFLEPNPNDSNKRRWQTSPFWENFLSGITPMKFASCLPDRDIMKIHSWFENQISKAFTMLNFAFNENNDEWLHKLHNLGKSKLKKEDIRIIEDYRRLIKYQNVVPDNLLETDIFTQKKEPSSHEGSKS